MTNSTFGERCKELTKEMRRRFLKKIPSELIPVLQRQIDEKKYVAVHYDGDNWMNQRVISVRTTGAEAETIVQLYFNLHIKNWEDVMFQRLETLGLEKIIIRDDKIRRFEERKY